MYSAYRQQRDLIAVGAYQKGSDPRTDEAIALYPQLSAFLQQETDVPVNLEEAEAGLVVAAKAS